MCVRVCACVCVLMMMMTMMITRDRQKGLRKDKINKLWFVALAMFSLFVCVEAYSSEREDAIVEELEDLRSE